MQGTWALQAASLFPSQGQYMDLNHPCNSEITFLSYMAFNGTDQSANKSSVESFISPENQTQHSRGK